MKTEGADQLHIYIVVGSSSVHLFSYMQKSFHMMQLKYFFQIKDELSWTDFPHETHNTYQIIQTVPLSAEPLHVTRPNVTGSICKDTTIKVYTASL